jgi:hypothetical protein
MADNCPGCSSSGFSSGLAASTVRTELPLRLEARMASPGRSCIPFCQVTPVPNSADDLLHGTYRKCTFQAVWWITSLVPIVNSILNACTGSIEAALRAGISVADSPISPINSATPANVHGSAADTPKS